MSNRARRRPRSNVRPDGPTISVELGLKDSSEVYEVAPGVRGFDVNIMLESATLGGPITEIGPGPDGSLMVVTGPPSFHNARRLLENGEPGAAVAAAHTASENYVRHVLEEWARLTRRPMPQLRSFSFHKANRALLDIYKDLSGDASFRGKPFWRSGRLTESVRRRNLIIHTGYICSRKEAASSIKTLRELHAHLETVLTNTSLRAPGSD